MSMSTKDIGNIGEDIVAKFLQKNGYEIVKRNFTIKGGEIDIIAKKDDTYSFVEVKTRKSNSLVSGENSITEAKKKHIIYTAECFFKKLGNPSKSRFDVAVVIYNDKKVETLKYYKNAFDASKR